MSILYFYLLCILACAIGVGIAGERVPPVVVKLSNASVVITGCVFVFSFGGRLYKFKVTERLKTFITETFVEALYSRNATVPKDMAFGMWAIIQQGSAIDLPAPNYSDSIGNIYRVFTVRVIQFAHSLDSLALAAVKSSEDQPSWVPDWSANKSHDWISTHFRAQQTDEYGYHLSVSLGTFANRFFIPTIEPQAILQQPQFRFDRSEMVLTVQARRICNIRSCLRFEPASESFHHSELSIHLENFRMMLTAASMPTISLSLSWSLPTGPTAFHTVENFPWSILDTIDSVGEEFDSVQLSWWIGFLKWCLGQDVHAMFDILLNDERLLAFQIRVCNVMAMQAKCVFLAQDLDRPDVDVWGMCSGAVRRGDQIIRVDGVPQLLIVREFPEGSENAVKIVSPLTLLRRRDRLTKRRESVEEVSEEFNIH